MPAYAGIKITKGGGPATHKGSPPRRGFLITCRLTHDTRHLFPKYQYICLLNNFPMHLRQLARYFLFQSGMFLLSLVSFCQDIPQPVADKGIYEFLDELAGSRITSVNSAVKPYSRSFIAKQLAEADANRDRLNPRQKKELDFYLMDFRKEKSAEHRAGGTVYPVTGDELTEDSGNDQKENTSKWLRGNKGIRRWDLFYYKDSLFCLTVNPILGGEVFFNSSGRATYWRNGLEARAYIARWGFFASLRDNHEKPLLGKPEYLTQRAGGHIKNGTDWSEMQGGVTYGWDWGNIGLVKDNISWGNNYNGAIIFGGRNPSFIQLRLHLNPVKWFEFNYFHAWLNSMVVDSTRSWWVSNSFGTDYREVYHKKFMAANMFTFIPVRYLYISAGNSIIYDNETLNPAYLVPLFFYKSVDHSLSSGIDNMNSQLFFDISSRQIRNLHLYATLFIDELSTSRIFKSDEWNYLSWKTGFRLSNYPVQNLSLTTEFTFTYPFTFQHYVPTLTFESNGYNLGHYLKDNAREWYVAFDYRPLRTMDLTFFFDDAVRGPDYTELGAPRLGNPPLDPVEWHDTSLGFKGSYQLINDLYFWSSFIISNIIGDTRWSPEYFYGKKNTFNFGMTFGF